MSNPFVRLVTRRTCVLTGLAALPLSGCMGPRWRAPLKERVTILQDVTYTSRLNTLIREALLENGFNGKWVRNKKVLLKPNIVEAFPEAACVTTHPAVVSAVSEVFMDWGGIVSVGEGSANLRDSDAIFYGSGIARWLTDTKVPFSDLNYEDTVWVPNCKGSSSLTGFHLPASVFESDLVVSLPKLKTHHWVGMSASIKNLYGILPGTMYGWPKSLMHDLGISETLNDLRCSLPNAIAIIDAVDCMEGDGPLMGDRKPMGLLVIGTDLVSVDATCARIMGLEPARIGYLQLAANSGCSLDDESIEQRGEPWRDVASPFRLPNHPHLTSLKADCAEPPSVDSNPK